MHRYKVYNAAMATTAATASTTTGTAIKTMVQLATPATRQIQLISWGFTVDDPPGADASIELIQTDVAASAGTAHVAAGVQPLDPNAPASLLTLGTSATGFSFGTENTTAASRVFDIVSLSSVSGESPLTYSYQFMPDERPIVAISKFLRIRATTPTTAVDLRCWICFDE